LKHYTVSKGSAVTSLRNGVMYNSQFLANFMLSLAVRGFWKSIYILRSYRHE